MSWPRNPRPAKSLTKLIQQINAAHPQRSKASDGLLGDAVHAARTSDHNPWVKDSKGVGVVTAADITNDPAHGVDGHILSRQLITDSRTKYVIFAGQIYRTYKPQLDWAAYTGPSRHDHHVHISVSADVSKYDDAAPWALGNATRRTLRLGDDGPDVAELQAKLGIKADGKFGNHTLFAVREFQAFHNIKVDGIVGPETRGLLFK